MISQICRYGSSYRADALTRSFDVCLPPCIDDQKETADVGCQPGPLLTRAMVLDPADLGPVSSGTAPHRRCYCYERSVGYQAGITRVSSAQEGLPGMQPASRLGSPGRGRRGVEIHQSSPYTRMFGCPSNMDWRYVMYMCFPYKFAYVSRYPSAARPRYTDRLHYSTRSDRLTRCIQGAQASFLDGRGSAHEDVYPGFSGRARADEVTS